MIASLFAKVRLEQNKKIIRNFFSLSVLQGANLIMPLITFPYLVRVLGVSTYGLVFFAQAFATYFSLLTDYGFNLSATREISLYKDNNTKLTRIYNSVLQAKISLMLVSFIIMLIIVLTIPRFSRDWELYFLTFGMVVGSSLFPIWFFQGIEKMTTITVLSTVSKFLLTISLFILVRKPNDYLYVPLLNSLSYIFIGLVSTIIVNRTFGVKFKFQKWKYVASQLKKGWYIFISAISINLYTATATFILGLLVSSTLLGYYVIAEKMIRIVTSLFAPLYQAIYPNAVRLVNNSRTAAQTFFRRIFMLVLALSFIFWLISFIFSLQIFNLLFHQNLGNSVFIFKILSPLIVVIPVASFLFNVVLLSYQLDKFYSKIYLISAALNVFLLLLFMFILRLGTMGAALSLLVTELVVTLLAVAALEKTKIKLISFRSYPTYE